MDRIFFCSGPLFASGTGFYFLTIKPDTGYKSTLNKTANNNRLVV